MSSDTTTNRNWFRVESTAVAAFFFFSFLVGPYRRWQTNAAVRLLLIAANTAGANLFNQLMGMLAIDEREANLYLVWLVFLGVAHETAVAAKAYSIYHQSTDRLSFEIDVLFGNAYVAVLMGLFPFEKFHGPLWALWCFTVAKMLQRVIGFRAAARTYGPENVDLVAHLMSFAPELEHEKIGDMPSTSTGDALPAMDYNYRIRGEDKIKYKYEWSTSRLTIKNKRHEEKIVTVDRIWNCEGRLLDNDGSIATRLKDMCLSFALFKLLRRRFRDYPAEDEGQRNKAKRLVLEKLLKEDDRRHCTRTFRVVRTELEFLHDLFYTKYPISFHRGISVLNILQLLAIGSSVWAAVWVIQGYYDHPDATWGKSNIDLVLTYVFTVLVIVMELCEFSMHLLSNWFKVLTTCNYVRHHRSRDRFHIDKLVAILGSFGTPWKPLNKNIGQYALFQAYKSHFIYSNLSKVSTWVFGEAEVGSGAKQSAPTKVTRDVQYAIFRALRDEGCCISNGERSLKRNRVYDHLSKAACDEESFDRKILVWHIATSYFELDMAAQEIKKKAQVAGEERPPYYNYSQVAVYLSRYCAYLLLFAPDLLPVNNLVAKLMFKDVISVAKEFFDKDVTWCDKLMSKQTKRMYEMMNQYHADEKAKHELLQGTIMAEGLNLAEQLKSTVKDERTRWKVLAEFWAEFILFLAPSDNAEAHREKLSNGGEFITHLWVLLYNAGILERPGRGSLPV